ncbi:MAG: hypothetical protein OJF50_004495 [Nitrospira sp.]|nr:hypothetical protein [Nitrospira sp.]
MTYGKQTIEAAITLAMYSNPFLSYSYKKAYRVDMKSG